MFRFAFFPDTCCVFCESSIEMDAFLWYRSSRESYQWQKGLKFKVNVCITSDWREISPCCLLVVSPVPCQGVSLQILALLSWICLKNERHWEGGVIQTSFPGMEKGKGREGKGRGREREREREGKTLRYGLYRGSREGWIFPMANCRAGITPQWAGLVINLPFSINWCAAEGLCALLTS